MTTEIFLVEALGDTNNIKPEKWMSSLGWFANEALDKIEYEDIGKLILLGLKKIRDRSYANMAHFGSKSPLRNRISEYSFTSMILTKLHSLS
jgi:hypothetical protein